MPLCIPYKQDYPTTQSRVGSCELKQSLTRGHHLLPGIRLSSANRPGIPVAGNTRSGTAPSNCSVLRLLPAGLVAHSLVSTEDETAALSSVPQLGCLAHH